MARFIIALCIALSCLAGCGDDPASEAPAVSSLPVVVADGRDADIPTADTAGWAAHPALQAAVATARAHWQGAGGLEDEEVRVLGVAAGAFTAAGTAQTAVLYVMSVWPRCCPRMGLAVVEGDRLVHHVAFEGVAQRLGTVAGLAPDGRDGLALTGTFGTGGENQTSVTLAVVDGGALTDLGSAPILYDPCAAGQPESEAARVTINPDRSFASERFARATCDGPWTSVGTEPLALDPPGESRYTVLPTG